MPDHHLPHLVLNGQLSGAKRATGGQKKLYEDYTKDLLKCCKRHGQLRVCAGARAYVRTSVWEAPHPQIHRLRLPQNHRPQIL